MLKGFAVSALALAVGLAAAPRLSAQSAPQRLVCKDGTVTTGKDVLTCFRHGGVDKQATARMEQGQYGVYPNTGRTGSSDTRGVYGGGVYDGVNGTRTTRARRDERRAHKHHDDDRRDARRDRDDDDDQGRGRSNRGRYDNRRSR